MRQPSGALVEWAAKAIGKNATVASVRSLQSTGGPWLLRIRSGDKTSEVVLKASEYHILIATKVEALELAARDRLPAPRLVSADLDGLDAGMFVSLETVLPGSTAIPRQASPERLRRLGAAAAQVHAIPLAPRGYLGERTRPMQYDHHDANRRWAMRYRATPQAERPALLERQTVELCGLTGWDREEARRVLIEAKSTSRLLEWASDVLQELPTPATEPVFVHGDLWQGNTMWLDETYQGLVDWDSAGSGDPGVDVGNLRLDVAIAFGQPAADTVLAGWEEAAGRGFEAVAYWDLVAALNRLDVIGHDQPIIDRGRADLDGPTCTARRDLFVRHALNRLGRMAPL